MLLLTRDPAYAYLTRVTVVEITTTIRNIPVEVRLGAGEGLSRPCAANFDNVHVIPKPALTDRVGALARARVGEVKRALGYAFDWLELKLP